MSDAALQLLAQQQRRVSGPQLLLADENLGAEALQLLPRERLTVVSNRYDLHRRALALGFDSHFSDFDLSDFADGSFQQVLFRVAKEKPLTHYLINQSRRLLAEKGLLNLVGEKSDGIKTYGKKAGDYLGDRDVAQKHGRQYLVSLHKLSTDAAPLDDRDYTHLRPCIDTGEGRLLSKPGQFGWNKIDEGSSLLVQHLDAFLRETGRAPTTLLDLGCGYGYLSAMAAHRCTARITATDNNAAALLSCRANFVEWGINGEVVAGDCGDTLTDHYDAVICNPPFHRGFDTDSDLTTRFAESCRRHLRPSGRALFVVNRFVPLEQCAAEVGLGAETVAENRGFRVLRLTPR